MCLIWRYKLLYKNVLKTSPKSILALHKMKKMNGKCQYDNLVYAWDTAQLMGESMLLIRVQLKEQDFEKKSDGDFQQLLYQNQFLRNVQKILGWHFSILTFSYTKHFPSFLVLGLILVQTALQADTKMS